MCCVTCDDLSIDHIFLTIMTGVSVLILYVDLKVLEQMFVEFFLIQYYIDDETYVECYKPQAELRIAFQCTAIYSAICCVILTSVLAFAFSDRLINLICKHIINISAIIYGPILSLGVIYGFMHIRALSRVCGVTGIKDEEVNVPSIILLLVFSIVAFVVSFAMIYSKTTDVAMALFTNEDSLLFSITSVYFRLN